MFPEGTRSPDGAIHEFKSGAGYLALRGGCDVLPVRISGTYEVLGKGGIIPHRHPVEVRIGRVITNAELRALADNAEGTGAYRKLADAMRAAVLALGERMPPAGTTKRTGRTQVAHGDDGGAAPIVAETAPPAGDAATRAAHRKSAAPRLRHAPAAAPRAERAPIRRAAGLWSAAIFRGIEASRR